jgi:protein-tyrosine phosphatase
MSLILFVCTGNVCRSPMGAGLLQQRLAREELDTRYKVASAGVWALDDYPASEKAVTVMAERGIDISQHIAHTITTQDMSAASLILVMSQEQQEMLGYTWPPYAWKVHRLSEMIGKRKDIADPYRGPIEDYRESADTIAQYIDEGFERILELA